MPQATAKPSQQLPTTKAPNIPSTATPIASFGQFAVPINQSDVDALQAQRNELSSQLISAKDRRNELSRQLRSAQVGPDKAGIEARITQLDNRILTIENDIAESGRA
ncbi:MAG TPA: hypothetical protein VGQ30_09640, partial [Gemmatimonadaceae bacterium]|nr:hypothetical protein [Gemmatimonadaceae bacterium]